MQTKNINLTLTNGTTTKTTKDMVNLTPKKNQMTMVNESPSHIPVSKVNNGGYEPIGMTSPIYQSMPNHTKFRSSNVAGEVNCNSSSAPVLVSNPSGPMVSVPNGTTNSKGVYQPPPLPPRVGSLMMRDPTSSSGREGACLVVTSAPSTPAANVSCSAGPYKPVPPPKPFAGYTTGQMHYLQENQDSLPLARNGGPISYPHILVTDQGQFVTHSTKFPIPEDTKKLVFNGNPRFNGGIDNPAMISDVDMRSVSNPVSKDMSVNHYAQMNSNYDASGRVSYSAHAMQQQARNGYTNPTSSVSYPSVSNSQPITTYPSISSNSGLPIMSTENWSANHTNAHNGSHFPAHQSPDKRHYQQLMNSRPGIPSSQQNGSARTISFAPGTTIMNHQELYNEQQNQCNGRPLAVPHVQMNGGPTSSQYTNGSVPQDRTPQEENASNGDNEENETRKDEKWGSLKKAGKTYSHLKNIISNKFNKGDLKNNNDEKTHPQINGNVSQGHNAQLATDTPANNSIPEYLPKFEQLHLNERQAQEVKGSFQRAVQYSSLKARLDEHSQLPRPDSSIYILPDRNPNRMSNGPTNYHGNAAQILASRHKNDNLAFKRAESCSHLVSRVAEPPPPGMIWSNHHRSDENLNRALPSDLPYPDLQNKTVSINHLPSARDGRVGSDSGRGTGGSGTEFKCHDTSLESGSSHRQHIQGQSSGNESEWIDLPDPQSSSRKSFGVRNGRVHYDTGTTTPPLPPLSPDASPKLPHKFNGKGRKQSHSFSLRANSKPDLLETTHGNEGPRIGLTPGVDPGNQGSLQRSTSLLPSSVKGWMNKNPHAITNPDLKRENVKNESNKKFQPQNGNGRIALNPTSNGAWKPFVNGGGGRSYDDADDDGISTDCGLDLNSMLDDGCTEATTDDDLASRDDEAYVIRRQLEGLEGMYSEVLKVLGSRRPGKHGEPRLLRRRLHGSMSSLPSSVMSSRPMTRDKKGRVIDDRIRRAPKEPPSKTIHKRFQRLESHVVTLARSVAHLSSEMRTQHLMMQEMESIRNELSSIRVATRTMGAAPYSKGNANGRSENTLWNPLESGHLALSNPGRVKKLTQFFGDEPPLVRLFLRKLGYEKYAKVFEEEKIGMLELPYLNEDRLQKIGIPLGPRLRILQEAQGPIKREGNLSVYVV